MQCRPPRSGIPRAGASGHPSPLSIPLKAHAHARTHGSTRIHARIHTDPRARAFWIAFALVGFGRQILQVRAGGPGALAGARVGQHVSAVDGRLLGDTDEEQAGEARLASALPGERVSLEVLFAAATTARWQCDVLLEHSVQSTPWRSCGVQNATFTFRRGGVRRAECNVYIPTWRRAACRMQHLHSNVAACRMQHLHSNVAACRMQHLHSNVAACRMQHLHSNVRRAECNIYIPTWQRAACCTHCGHFTVALLRA